MDKIFIPSVNRVNEQITYYGLPDDLKQKVVFVVQEWERQKYSYDAEYLVLPSAVNLDDYYCIAKTRKIIYEAGKDIKYAVLDDDLTFKRRNARYWTGRSNMPTSKRAATPDEIRTMFETYSKWLDEPDVTICGCGHDENPPASTEFRSNGSLGSALWINGPKFKHILPELDLTSVKVAEDTYFLLQMLTRGHGNRVSNEFLFHNSSVHKKSVKSDIWDKQTFEDTQRDHEYIASKLPDFFKVLYEENGNRVAGGFRNFGKTRVSWSKAFKSSQL
ncbi:MAG: hypothetical protein HWD92_13470 [Flavobacteriia bacterium]|nr:hypothetical protein [Flavobacteriia bacterium]